MAVSSSIISRLLLVVRRHPLHLSRLRSPCLTIAHLRLGALARCQSRPLTPLIDHDLQLGSLYLASAQQGILRETPFKNIEYGKPNTVVGQPWLSLSVFLILCPAAIAATPSGSLLSCTTLQCFTG